LQPVRVASATTSNLVALDHGHGGLVQPAELVQVFDHAFDPTVDLLPALETQRATVRHQQADTRALRARVNSEDTHVVHGYSRVWLRVVRYGFHERMSSARSSGTERLWVWSPRSWANANM